MYPGWGTAVAPLAFFLLFYVSLQVAEPERQAHIPVLRYEKRPSLGASETDRM